MDTHLRTTESLLVELGLERVPRLLVFNKSDLLDRTTAARTAHAHDGVAVSALDPKSLVPLEERIDELLPREIDWEAEPAPEHAASWDDEAELEREEDAEGDDESSDAAEDDAGDDDTSDADGPTSRPA